MCHTKFVVSVRCPVMPHMTTYGAQMDRKWTGSGLEVTGSGPEVDWKCPSVRPYICPSQTLPLPPWRTLCEGSTSAGRLRPAIFYVIRTLHKKSRQSLRPSTGRIGWDFFSKIGIEWGTYFSKKVPIFETFWFTPAMHRPLTVKGVYVVSHSWYVQVYELVCITRPSI